MRRVLTFGIVGLVAQMVDGSLGMGYGVTSTSLLVTTGTAAALASATVHLSEVGTALVSGAAHHRFGNVDWRSVRRLAVPGAVGAFLGAIALGSVPATAAEPFVAVVLGLLGMHLLLRSLGRRGVAPAAPGRHGRRFLGALGLGAGFLDAAGGGGWGPLGTSTLMAGNRMEPRTVIGTVAASEFLVSVGATAGFALVMPWSSVDPLLVGALLLGGSVAAPASAWLVHHLEPRTLGVTVALFLVATNGRTLASAAGVDSSTLAAVSVLLAAVWLVTAVRLGVGVHRGLRAARSETRAVPLPQPALASATPDTTS